MKKSLSVGLFLAALFVLMVILMMLLGETEIKLNNEKLKNTFSQSQFNKDYYESDKFLLIYVWATWSAPCVSDFPALENLAGKNKNVQFISIAIDKDTIKLKEYLSKNPGLKLRDITFRNLNNRETIYKKINLIDPFVDNAVIQFHSMQIPYTVLIKNKKIVYKTHEDLNSDALQTIINTNSNP